MTVMHWLLDHALSHPQIHRTEAFYDLDNGASARVLKKTDIAFEGVLRCYFLHLNISGVPRDCRMYARAQ